MNRIDKEVLRSAICSIKKPRTYSGAYDIVFFIFLSRNSNYFIPFIPSGTPLSSKNETGQTMVSITALTCYELPDSRQILSILTAQTLYSGIWATGSSAELVSRLAAASAK